MALSIQHGFNNISKAERFNKPYRAQINLTEIS